MRPILRIARLELNILFYSPIAWLVLIVFAIQSALAFFGSFFHWVLSAMIGNPVNRLTAHIYAGFPGYFIQEVQPILILYVPLMTMGIFSREIASGTIKLPQSSPIRGSDLVLGKYLALMVYALCWIATLGLFCLAGHFMVLHQDNLLVLSGLIGMYLLIIAYMAIGLFMSSLTSHQVVAAVSTIAVFASLEKVRELWSDVPFWRDITYFLSVSGRTIEITDGLISSKDVAYFLIVICLSLGLVMIKLRNQRDDRGLGIKIIRYAVLSLILLSFGYITSQPTLTGYIDMTRTSHKTITPAAQTIMKKVKEPVYIHTYTNLLDENAWAGMPNAHNFIIHSYDNYQRFLPRIHYEFSYYYDSSQDKHLFESNPGLSLKQLAEKVAKIQHFDTRDMLSPEEMRRVKDMTAEENRFITELTIGNKRTYIRRTAQGFPSEAQVTAAVKRLTDGVMTVGFVTGHAERSMHQYADETGIGKFAAEPYFKFSLINEGFDVRPVRLNMEDIPGDLKMLVIADPKLAFTPAELYKLERYVGMGGSLLIAAEPGRQDIVNPILAIAGVQMLPGMLVQESRDYGPTYIRGELASGASDLSKQLDKMRTGKKLAHMTGAGALSVLNSRDFIVDTLVSTDSATTWNRAIPSLTDSGEAHFLPGRGDVRGCFPTALFLRRVQGKARQGILVLGDADCISNWSLTKWNPQESAAAANYDLVTEPLKWCADDAYPLDLSRPEHPDNQILIRRKPFKVVRFFYVGVLPLVMLITGALILIRRRRK